MFLTSTNISTTGFANMFGMAVLPMWWTATTFSPSAAATCFASASNASRHRGSCGTTSTFLMNSAPHDLASRGRLRLTAGRVGLGGRTLHVRPAPEANTLDQRQHRTTVGGQRILDGGGD